MVEYTLFSGFFEIEGHVWRLVIIEEEGITGGMMMFEKKEKRFCLKEEENYGSGIIRVIVDTKTGVNYIMTTGVGGSSITPLLDSNGNVTIDT